MTTVPLDVTGLLDGLDRLAAQQPVAARVVAMTNSDHAGAAELARLVGGDPALAVRVLKLANSAYFGLSGKVSSLPLAVTVVGFSAVRSLATVTLAGLGAAAELPQGFWETSVHLAAACGSLGLDFWQPAADAMCLGLLAPLGSALLHQADPQGYDALLAATDLGVQRIDAEGARYGICTPQLTAAALQKWNFPPEMVEALRSVPEGVDGALLRTGYELTGRLLDPHHEKQSLARLSNNRLTESEGSPRLALIKGDVAALRAALGL